MAKLSATEAAQRVIDRAVQMFGGRGVVRGEIVERLYREIRALRIYEGATEVQKLIIGRELLKAAEGTRRHDPRGPATGAAGRARAAMRTESRHAAARSTSPDRSAGTRRAASRATASPSRCARRSLNIVAVLAEAGGRPGAPGAAHVVRHEPRRVLRGLPELGAAYREVIGSNFPAMAVVQVVALMEARAKVEIEATAVIPDRSVQS